jgi:hypothetical protein
VRDAAEATEDVMETTSSLSWRSSTSTIHDSSSMDGEGRSSVDRGVEAPESVEGVLDPAMIDGGYLGVGGFFRGELFRQETSG